MILAALGAILGAILGWRSATKRDGNTADKLQYAAAYGIAFLLIGYFIALFMAKWGI